MQKKINWLLLFGILILNGLSNIQAKEIIIDRIQVLSINSSINPATEDYIKSEYKKFTTNDLVVIKLNTPGGLVSVTKEIITTIGNSDALTAVWVTPEGASATSAGAIISSASHFLFMSPGTNIGAATPIGMGSDIEQKDARSKAINDLVALVKSLSQARSRNSAPFEKMISEAQSFTDSEAMSARIVDAKASVLNEIVQFIQDRSITIKGESVLVKLNPNYTLIEKPMTTGQMILNILANPSTAYILFLIGAALIYFELQSPGGFIAGAIGTLFLILAGIAFQVLPLNVGSLGLILLAFVLFVLEIYITSYGLLSLAGLISLIFGSLFLFKTDNSYMQVNLQIIFSTLTAVLSILGGIGYMLWRDRKKDFHQPFELIGHEGEVISVLPNNLYQVKVFGEIWSAHCNEPLQMHDQVKVIEKNSDKLQIQVAKLVKT
jgi:membrane-bound serine protease (ClpP class)